MPRNKNYKNTYHNKPNTYHNKPNTYHNKPPLYRGKEKRQCHTHGHIYSKSYPPIPVQLMKMDGIGFGFFGRFELHRRSFPVKYYSTTNTPLSTPIVHPPGTNPDSFFCLFPDFKNDF